MCRTIVEVCRRYSDRQIEDGVKENDTLLHTIVNQRTNRGTTPLMIACDRGYEKIVELLLGAGADALCLDLYNYRTCLHYAAISGKTSCVDYLTRDDTTIEYQGRRLPLRECLVNDPQVKSAKFIDQRSFGGLTALHFAAVAGSLESAQILLRRGAAIMVKTDGDAFIGDEYLNPGSTPLHVAVLVSNVSIAHALLQAHAELMSAAGPSSGERGRRPWEGHSRTDIRSVRNSHRKMPYHLARERGRRNLMQLVDPRINIDFALDQVRDAQQGLGAKRLSSICALAVQKSLLQWLDNYEKSKDAQKQADSQLARQTSQGNTSVAKKNESEITRGGTSLHGRHITVDDSMFHAWRQQNPLQDPEDSLGCQDDQAPRAMIRVHSENNMSLMKGPYRNLRDMAAKMKRLPASEESDLSAMESSNDFTLAKSDSFEGFGKDVDSLDHSSCAHSDDQCCTASYSRECGVCLDTTVEVRFQGCGHELCIECSRNLTLQEKKPPICPFCRQRIVGFTPATTNEV